MAGTRSGPPPFARMAADPLRWQLLQELARSDRRVRELVALVGRPQNLVSYHLKQLRASGLVATRRSSFDGRDTYYRLDLARCAESLAAAGAALHPGLGGRAPAGEPPPCSVLFLCTGNSARSQVAEALARTRSGGRIAAASAGSRPKPLHPYAEQVMAARGIDLAGQRPKHLDEFAGRRFCSVITLCDRVREICPEHPAHLHWSIPDPAAGDGGLQAFESMAAELDTRIGFWLAAAGAAPVHAHVQEV
ncbi:ArsR family transcriptional regulator [Actinomadura sp. ATCC 31491]|uniref:ArsR family transcriptional regulator n=1 Tax=Actinomadura luzonensis TaxID=2805427 RepID=A0ABT0FQB1_9ACTN|nr:ArsR family transcriptional regulator [Actinomadura luzonensis]MCK2214323.1 ArsR family transcriptional regulator [Actinomadura luzonensis]